MTDHLLLECSQNDKERCSSGDENETYELPTHIFVDVDMRSVQTLKVYAPGVEVKNDMLEHIFRFDHLDSSFHCVAFHRSGVLQSSSFVMSLKQIELRLANA